MLSSKEKQEDIDIRSEKEGEGRVVAPGGNCGMVFNNSKIYKHFGAFPRLQCIIFLYFSRKMHGNFYTAIKWATEVTRKRVVWNERRNDGFSSLRSSTTTISQKIREGGRLFSFKMVSDYSATEKLIRSAQPTAVTPEGTKWGFEECGKEREKREVGRITYLEWRNKHAVCGKATCCSLWHFFFAVFLHSPLKKWKAYNKNVWSFYIRKRLLSEVGFEPTPTEVDCDLNAAP